jgi:hypothetical protein
MVDMGNGVSLISTKPLEVISNWSGGNAKKAHRCRIVRRGELVRLGSI